MLKFLLLLAVFVIFICRHENFNINLGNSKKKKLSLNEKDLEKYLLKKSNRPRSKVTNHFIAQKANKILDKNSSKLNDDKILVSKAGFELKPCRPSTIENPFMNPRLTVPDRSFYPCSESPEGTDVVKNFDFNLVKDLDDLFDKKNAERQFYTIPGAAFPPPTVDFANWLYNTTETCNSDGASCLRDRDKFMY